MSGSPDIHAYSRALVLSIADRVAQVVEEEHEMFKEAATRTLAEMFPRRTMESLIVGAGKYFHEFGQPKHRAEGRALFPPYPVTTKHPYLVDIMKFNFAQERNESNSGSSSVTVLQPRVCEQYGGGACGYYALHHILRTLLALYEPDYEKACR